MSQPACARIRLEYRTNSSHRRSALLALGVFLGLVASLVASLGFASTARAFSISIEPTTSLDTLSIGDEFTVGVVLSNPDGRSVNGIGVSAFGFDEAILRPTTIATTQSVFSQSFLSPAGDAVTGGGLFNVLSPGGPAPVEELLDGTRLTRVVTAISIVSTEGTGLDDIGVAGGRVGDGDFHATISFQVLDTGMTSISIGSLFKNGDALVLPGGAIVEVTPAVLEISVGDGAVAAIPEPSSALLFVAGLAVIASQRKKLAQHVDS